MFFIDMLFIGIFVAVGSTDMEFDIVKPCEICITLMLVKFWVMTIPSSEKDRALPFCLICEDLSTYTLYYTNNARFIVEKIIK
jgi:hypothetical protein